MNTWKWVLAALIASLSVAALEKADARLAWLLVIAILGGTLLHRGDTFFREIDVLLGTKGQINGAVS